MKPDFDTIAEQAADRLWGEYNPHGIEVISAALRSTWNAAIEDAAVVAAGYRDRNPNAIASVQWTARQCAKAILALKATP